MKFTERTAQGYEIVSIVRLKETNVAIVFKREFVLKGESATRVDYGWANGYDEETGTWAHGHYDFSSQEEATKDMMRFKTASPEGSKKAYNVLFLDYDSDGKLEEMGLAGHRTYAGAKAHFEAMKVEVEEGGDEVESMRELSWYPYEVIDAEILNTVHAGYKATDPKTGHYEITLLIENEPEE